MTTLSRNLIALVAPFIAQIVLTAPLFAADPAAPSPAASSPATGSSTKWKTDLEKMRQDPSLVRLYLFDEGKGLAAANSANVAGDKKGNLTLLSNSPYGMSREENAGWSSGLFQTFPEWTEGRWPGKSALRNGLARTCVVRSQFNGTKSGIFTLAAWVRAHDGPCLLFSIGGGKVGWGISYQATFPDGQVGFGFVTPTGTEIVTASPFNPGIWHQLVCLWDGKMLKIYIDGAQKTEKPCAGPYIPLPMSVSWGEDMLEMDTKGLHIGGGGAGNGRFDVDELAIFDRVLSADEVRSHYEAGNPVTTAAEQKALLATSLAAEKAIGSISMDIPKETYGFFQRGVKIPAKISIPASAGLNGTFTAHFLLRDLRNSVVVEETRELTASPDKEATATIELAPALCGIYFLDMWLADSAGKTVKKLREEYGIAITVPLPPPDKIPLSSPLCAFNITGNFYENRFLGFGVDRWIRGSEAYKRFGEVDPKVFGADMDFEKKSGRKVMFCLHVDMPAWAERAPGKKFVLRDMNIFADYCKQMVRLYKDMVVGWEIENEPNGGNLMTPEEYVAMLKVAYKAIKEEDPKAVVVGLSGVDHLNWNEAVFKAGGAKDFDILSFHNYGGPQIGIEKINEQLLKYRGERVPIWNTESGVHPVVRVDGRPMAEDVFLRRFGAKMNQSPGKAPWMSADMAVLLEHDAACLQVNSILSDLAAGCQKYFMLNGASHYTPIDNTCDGQPTEVGPAVAALASVLIPSRSVEKLPLSSSSDAGAIITQDGGRRIAALSSDETPTLSFRVNRSGQFEGMDLLGNPLSWTVSAGNILNIKLGRAPVYVFDVPKGFEQVQFLKVKAASVLPENGILEGELTLLNPLDKPLAVTLKGTAPKGATIEVADQIELKAGESKTVTFRLDGQKLGRRTFELAFELFDGTSQLGKLSHAFASEGTINKIPELPAKAALADGTWWKSVEPVVCNEVDHVVQGKPIVAFPWAPHWGGPKDLSYTTRMAWQEDGSIFLRIEVTDDVVMPAPKEKHGMCFQYDCIELFVDERGLGQRNDLLEKGVEQVLVIPNAAKTVAPCDFWYGYARAKPTTHAEFVGGATPTGYWVEGKLTPEPGTPFRVKAGTQFAFEVNVDDRDSEDIPRKVIMALHGDAISGTQPSKWGRYQLQP